MFSNNSLNKSDLNMTTINNDSFSETQKPFKYLEHWKRVRKAIKFNLMISRFNNLNKSHRSNKNESPFTVNEVTLQGHLALFQDKPEIITNSFVFIPHGRYYLLWTFIIILSLVYLSGFGIFHAAFIGDSVDSDVLKIEAFIDIIFIFDILIHLNLAIYDSKNNLVFDRKTIVYNYFKGRLFIDFLAAIPTGFFISKEEPSIIVLRYFFKMLKWIGIQRKLGNYTIVKSIDAFFISHRNLMESLSLVLVICSIIHVFACLFFLTARYENFSYETWVVKSGIEDFLLSEKYLTSAYFIVTTLCTLGYGDIRPHTKFEQVLTLFWSFLGLFLVSFSVSYFTVIIDRLLKRDTMVNQTLLMLEDFNKSISMHKSLFQSIKNFISNKKIVNHKIDISKVLESLDINLKYEIALNIYNQAIQKITFFNKKSSEFLSQVTFLLEFFKCEENEYIWRKNSSTDGLFFLISGKVKFMHNGMLFFFYYDGGFFGDMEIFLKCERKFDVMVCEPCQCFKMNLKTLKLVKKKFPKYYDELKNTVEIRKNNLFASLAQMIAVLQYNKGEILNISKSYIENLMEQYLTDMLSITDSENISRFVENSLLDLKKFHHHKNRIKSLLKSENIFQSELKSSETFRESNIRIEDF